MIVFMGYLIRSSNSSSSSLESIDMTVLVRALFFEEDEIEGTGWEYFVWRREPGFNLEATLDVI
jgi:hypothetical protein